MDETPHFACSLNDSSEGAILRLNNDCLYEIFSRIPCVREVLRMKRVCKRFNDAVTSYFEEQPIKITSNKHLYYRSEFKPISEIKVEICLEKLFLSCPLIISLNTLIFPPKIWWDLDKVKSMPSLVNLVLNTYSPRLSSQCLEKILQVCKNLKSITFMKYRRKRFNMECFGESIQSLVLKETDFDARGKENHGLDIIKRLGKQLIYLKITGTAQNSVLTVETLREILAECPRLRSFHINYPISSYEPLLEMKNMHELVIHSLSQKREYIDRRQYKKVIQNNQSATKLYLPLCHQHFQDFLANCIVYCPDIQDVFCTCPSEEISHRKIRNFLRTWHEIKTMSSFDSMNLHQTVTNIIRAAFG